MRTLLCILAFCCLAMAQAVTYFVSLGGSDTNPGTLKAPWRTLYKGLASLHPGDVLTVRGGTYDEVLRSVPIRQGLPGSRIWVKNFRGERPVLRGLLWLQRPSYWTFYGINVTWRDGESSRSHMVKIVNGAGWTFRDCEVWGARSYAGILVAGTQKYEPRNWKIHNVRVHDTYKSNDVDTNQQHGIYVHTGLTAGKGTIERSTIWNCFNGMGVKVGGADPGQGSANVTVQYNTIVDCAQGIMCSWSTKHTLILRNLIGRTGAGYGAIRGFELDNATNVAKDNYAFLAKSVILNYNGGKGVQDGGGNVLGVDPELDSLFKPAAPLPYGHLAPTPTL
jgi:hypothetical protein